MPPVLDLSVIIVTDEHKGYLEPCLTSLWAGGSSCSFEVLVVDNDSADGTADMVAQGFPQVRLLGHLGKWGFAKNCNLGMAHSQGRYLLLLNPDTEVLPGALGEMVSFMDQHPRVGVGGAKLLFPDGSLQYSAHSFSTVPILLIRGLHLDRLLWHSAFMRNYMMWDWNHEDARPLDMVVGACLIARRATVEEIGPLDEGFFLYFEDQDWCYRAWEAGWEVYYIPNARVVHHHRRASARGWLQRSSWIHVASMLRFFRKHYLHPRGLVAALRGPSLRRQSPAQSHPQGPPEGEAGRRKRGEAMRRP